jgi:serine phosphatase RsbU (regulator of sigma subunit)
VWDGGARFLDVSAGVALGVREDATYAGAPFALGEGSMLVLYTDSLVERRGEPIDAGLERLRRAGEGHGPHDTLCSALVELMDVTGDDDLAVVTVRWEES